MASLDHPKAKFLGKNNTGDQTFSQLLEKNGYSCTEKQLDHDVKNNKVVFIEYQVDGKNRIALELMRLISSDWPDMVSYVWEKQDDVHPLDLWEIMKQDIENN